MNNHPPPRPFHRPTTTTQVLQQTTAVFITRHHLLPILFLSFVSHFFRYEMETYADSLTSFIDNDPSIKSLYPPKPTSQNLHQLTGVNEIIKQQLFENSFFTAKPQSSNATPITLDSFDTRFSNAKLSFKSSNDVNTEIDYQNPSAFYARLVLFVSYGFMILLYVLSQSTIHGIIFVLVVNHVLKNRTRFLNTYLKGEILGQKRVWWMFLLRWGLTESYVQILSLWFVKRDDRYSVFKIIVKMSFLPFSMGFPSVKGFEKEIYGYTLSYILFDMITSFIFNVWVWVFMGDSRNTYGDSFDEWGDLFSSWIYPSVLLKSLENIVTARVTRFVLTQVFGEFLGSFIRSYMEIYFMVVWMMYYFSVKSMDANTKGEPFGRKEFEDMLSDDR